MGVVPFQDLPITDEETFDPNGRGRAAVENDILGDADSPDWDRFKKAHLWFDPDNADKKSGYKLIVARMVGGQLKVIWRQLTAAVAVLNGARGGANIPAADKKAAFNHAMKYYAKKGIEPKDRPSFTGAASTTRRSCLFGRCVKLADAIAESVDAEKLVWAQIARVGDFPGYRRGTMPFSLTREMFEQMIANLHANPSYEADENGVGKVRVVPWDFHHASEMDPREGDIAITGAPSQAWTYDLEIRSGDDGVDQLWSLTEFLEPAKTYVREKKYQWTSVAVDPDCIDDMTAMHVGAVLTSVALTNQPVVKGMDRLAAAVNRMPISADRYYWIDPAEDADEAFEKMRELFGLPVTSGLAEVVAELSKFRQIASGVLVVPGVDVDDLIAAMRKLFNLPALASVDEVMAEADKMIAAVVESQAAQQVAGKPGAMAASAASTNNDKEREVELTKILAGQLGVREADDAVKAAVGDLVALRDGMKQLLEVSKDSSKDLLEATERSVSARKKLTSILKALGVEDTDTAVNRIADMMKQSDELKKAMPELENLRARVAKQDEEQAEADVAEVIASNNYDEKLKDALLLQRKSDPEKFRQQYPKPAPKPNEGHLLGSIVTTPPGGSAPVLAAGGAPFAPAVNLGIYPGRNREERAIAHILATVPGSDKWQYEQLCTAAFKLSRSEGVVDQPVQ